MGLLTPSLSKLKIAVYDTKSGMQVGGMEVDFNPASLQFQHQLQTSTNNYLDQEAPKWQPVRSLPAVLSLELVLDGSLPGSDDTVEEKLNILRGLFLKGSSVLNGEADHHLRLYWGQMKWQDDDFFAGRIESMSIRQTLFDSDGTTLRATVNLSLKEATEKISGRNNTEFKGKLVNVVSVPDGLSALDMLSLINSISGIVTAFKSSAAALSDYLDIATGNDLDSLDDFEAGDELSV